MDSSVNKAGRQAFVDSFLCKFKSPGVNIPFDVKLYGKNVKLIEGRCRYYAEVKDKTKSCNNLVLLAEFLYDVCFDSNYIYIPPEQKQDDSAIKKVINSIKEKFIRLKDAKA